MKLSAALKQRVAFRAEIGFCRTKFAPIWNACWVVVVPFRMAKVTEFLLLGALRKTLEHPQPPFEVVTIYNDGIKFLRAEDFLAGTDATADFDLDGQAFPRPAGGHG